ncbi:MAG: chitinase [Glaciecola sp.]|jgi:chitinase
MNSNAIKLSYSIELSAMNSEMCVIRQGFKLLPKLLIGLLSILLLSACGGGDAERPKPDKVLVNAGQNIEVNEQVSVVLDGVANSVAGGIVYSWSANPSLTFEQADAATAAASLLTPAVTAITDYSLTLTATDINGTVGTDSIQMRVNPINISPVAVILAPKLDMYELETYPILSAISLDGNTSSDTDPQTTSASISAYLWQQVAGPDVLSGNILTASTLAFNTPVLTQTEQIIIRLQVTDQEGATATADKTLTLLGESLTIPDLSIGPAQTVFAGELFALSGLASSNASGAEPFSAIWSSNSSLAPIIGDPNSMKTFSIAPLVSQQTEIVYQLMVTDNYGNSQNKTQTMIVQAQALTRLNDTGMSLNANNIENLAVYQGEFAGQDAHNGFDRMAASGTSDKAGRGELGFDFTRLNQNGDEIDQATSDWQCVRDNITGLIWENKTDIVDNIHDAQQLYTWYSQTDNGGFPGEVSANSMACNLDSGNCNTEVFIASVNAQGLCGFFDWRLPTHTELLSLVHFGKAQAPLIESEYFVNMGLNDLAPVSSEFLWYWTVQPNVDGVSDAGAQNAWAIDFNSGIDNFINKSTQARVKLVRAGR